MIFNGEVVEFSILQFSMEGLTPQETIPLWLNSYIIHRIRSVILAKA